MKPKRYTKLLAMKELLVWSAKMVYFVITFVIIFIPLYIGLFFIKYKK